MTERPILFSKPMVRAILANRKTQTRRVAKHLDNTREFIYRDGIVWASLKPDELAPLDENPPRSVFGAQVIFDGERAYTPIVVGGGDGHYLRCPHGDVGDRLWVRETWCLLDRDHWADPRKPQVWLYSRASPRRNAVAYWAETDADGDRCRIEYGYKWRPSIHMPHWASRLTLEITGVRLQRLQEISEEDAVAEGAGPGFVPCPHPKFSDMQSSRCVGCRPMFARLWDEINAKRGYVWSANPMVWAITFKRTDEGNHHAG